MLITQKKTKAMVFNHTDIFTTRLQLKGENIEIVNMMKILGTKINCIEMTIANALFSELE